MSVTRRKFMQYLGLAPIAVGAGALTTVNAWEGIQVSERPRAMPNGLRTVQARCTLMRDGEPLPYSKTLDLYLGDNEFVFRGNIGRVTGYRLENGMGKISGEDFRDAIVADQDGDILRIVVKGV